jgi:hypothetical protein
MSEQSGDFAACCGVQDPELALDKTIGAYMLPLFEGLREGASGPDSSALSRLGHSIGQFPVEIVMDKGAEEQVMYQVRGSSARLSGRAFRNRDSSHEDL